MKVKILNLNGGVSMVRGVCVGQIVEVACYHPETGKVYLFSSGEKLDGDTCSQHGHRWMLGREHYEIIEDNPKTMASLKEKFALAFKKEPEKSFIKVGITNHDESFTSEGRDVFLAYLLEKHKEDFNKVVVQPMLEEEKAKKE